MDTADGVADTVFSVISIYYFFLVFPAHAGQGITGGFRERGTKALNGLIRLVRVQIDDLHLLIFGIRDQRGFVVSCFDAVFPKDRCV